MNPKEVMAMAELGCPHITISAANLQALAETVDTLPPITNTKPSIKYDGWKTPTRFEALIKTDPLASKGSTPAVASMEIDYVANGGQKLDDYINGDATVKKRIEDARDFFLLAENTAKTAIEAEIAAQKL